MDFEMDDAGAYFPLPNINFSQQLEQQQLASHGNLSASEAHTHTLQRLESILQSSQLGNLPAGDTYAGALPTDWQSTLVIAPPFPGPAPQLNLNPTLVAEMQRKYDVALNSWHTDRTLAIR
ncbi:hypothetical protein Vretimale_13831 [Volvox reticuliferus]|uniref:Uncharacterized protein n=1 Tax=Volvox reticuliferus TaxID=1737510 RepID=A0A8J4GM33_9CHLO|nr:hypothetical protein Vretimale_13831 [Volvox reticuliferus]